MKSGALTSTRELMADDAQEVFNYYYGKGYTDGLPIIPPTEQRVQEMIAASGRSAQQVIAHIPPANGAATVEKIAVNALMAGCRPEYMDLVITAVEAMTAPEFKLEHVQTTTNPITPCIILNGPVRKQLGVNCTSGVMGPGWRANATIGRAIRLILLNIGGAVPGDVDKSTQGFVGKYTLCIGENEEESPWPPLHVERGFAQSDSTVTLIGANASINLHDSSPGWKDALHSLTLGLKVATANNYTHPLAEPLIVLNPSHARLLSDAGFTKDKLKEYFFQNARIPLDWLTPWRQHARLGAVEGAKEYLHVGGFVPICWNPGKLIIVVAGGPQGGHSCYLPTGVARAVTRKISSNGS